MIGPRLVSDAAQRRVQQDQRADAARRGSQSRPHADSPWLLLHSVKVTVHVAERSETEVHVIEGAADVYDAEGLDHRSSNEIHLVNGEAGKFAKGRERSRR